MKILIVVLGLLLFSSAAQAGDLLLHGPSLHIPDRSENNATIGLGYLSDSGFAVGAYRNSQRKASVYAAYHLPLATWGRLELGVVGGVATGYGPALVPGGIGLARISLDKDWRIYFGGGPTWHGAVLNLSVGRAL